MTIKLKLTLDIDENIWSDDIEWIKNLVLSDVRLFSEEAGDFLFNGKTNCITEIKYDTTA